MERLLDYFVPEKYILDLVVDKFAKTIDGVVTVTGEVKGEIVKFHAVKLEIADVLVNGEKAEFKADGEILEVRDVMPGPAEITIYYNGKLNENMEGAYLSTYEYNGKTEVVVATQFESHYARQAFPCIDEPAAKAVFELAIYAPGEDVVLSNMAESGSGAFRSAAARELAPAARGDGLAGRGDRPGSVHVFPATPRMSTYLLAFVIGKFHGKTIKNAHGIEITTYCALNQDIDSVDFANEIAARSLEFYDDNFGVPYPLEKLDQVALPDFEAGAMENWGLVTYRESMLLVGKAATLGAKKAVAVTVAHELSHQWFGNLVTMEWWDDLWLNESFATIMEYYAVDAIHPEYKIFEGFFTGDCYAALLRDAYTGVQSVHQEISDPAEIATLFDYAIVYAKGARLMLMVIRLMGWDNFCKGIKDYFEKYQYKNTVGDNLWDSLKLYADFDPKALVHAFIDKPGYPVAVSDEGSFAKFSQQRFLLDGPLESADWPLPKITEDMSGHYILNLSEDEFSARLENFDQLGLEEKLRLLIDRDLVTKSGLQSAASLVPLAQEFRHENSAAVWNKVAALVGNLKVYFDDESAEEKLLKKYTLDLVDEKLAEIGLTTGRDDDENLIRLRANLLGLDYFAEDKERLRELAAMYDSDYQKMDNEIRDDILSAKAYLEPEIVDEYIAKYQATADPDVKFDYLASACLVRNEKQLQKLLDLLGNMEIVKPQDQLYLFVYLYRNPKSRQQTFARLTNNWDLVKKTSGEKSLSDYPTLIARVARTDMELQKYIDFFGPLRKDPALSRAIEVGEREIRARIKLIAQNKDSVYKALEL